MKNNNLQKIADKYSINTIYLFGSQATSDVHKNSDHDFAVQIKKNISEKKYFEIKMEIARELGLLYEAEQCDVIILNREAKTSLVMKFRAIKTGKIIHVDDEIERSRLEHRIMSYYFDRQYYSKRYIKMSLKNIANKKNL